MPFHTQISPRLLIYNLTLTTIFFIFTVPDARSMSIFREKDHKVSNRQRKIQSRPFLIKQDIILYLIAFFFFHRQAAPLFPPESFLLQ